MIPARRRGDWPKMKFAGRRRKNARPNFPASWFDTEWPRGQLRRRVQNLADEGACRRNVRTGILQLRRACRQSPGSGIQLERGRNAAFSSASRKYVERPSTSPIRFDPRRRNQQAERDATHGSMAGAEKRMNSQPSATSTHAAGRPRPDHKQGEIGGGYGLVRQRKSGLAERPCSRLTWLHSPCESIS